MILGVSAVLYAIYRVPASGGSMGGTAMGLAFGIVGFAFMIFAGLLGARKKVPVWRVGRAQMWMRGHLWLGLLSLPLILFHAGFHTGGPLTTALMWLLVIVVASGLFGAILQHYLPAVMTREAPLETIYDEMDHVNAQLRQEAAELVERAGAQTAADEEGVTISVEEQAAPLHNFFAEEVRPFLENDAAERGPLSDASLAERSFAQLKRLLPPERARDGGRSRGYLRGAPAARATGAIAPLAARLAAGAHSVVAGAAATRRGACGDRAAILEAKETSIRATHTHNQKARAANRSELFSENESRAALALLAFACSSARGDCLAWLARVSQRSTRLFGGAIIPRAFGVRE